MAKSLGMTGDLSSRRYLACLVDNVVALLAALVVAALVAREDEELGAASFVLCYLGYFLVGEGAFAATFGKRAFGLRVVDDRGEKAGWARAAGRTFARLIEVNPLLLGGLPAGLVILMTRTNQRLGDLVTRSYVVRVDEAVEDRSDCPACGEPLAGRVPCPICGYE